MYTDCDEKIIKFVLGQLKMINDRFFFVQYLGAFVDK